jgi:hypothetical protein
VCDSRGDRRRKCGARLRALHAVVETNSVNVDIALTSLGKREEHFAGGTGESQQWPTILPMWFTYTNPVSGRVPELHRPACLPCADHPELNLDRNGYQEPPNAPAANRAP